MIKRKNILAGALALVMAASVMFGSGVSVKAYDIPVASAGTIVWNQKVSVHESTPPERATEHNVRYDLKLDKSGTVTISLDAVSGGWSWSDNGHLAIFDPSGKELFMEREAFSNKPNSSVKAVNLIAGDYIVVIHGYSGIRGDFITNAVFSFKDSGETVTDSLDDQHNTILTAAKFPSSGSLKGFFAVNDDKDVYEYTASKSGKLRITAKTQDVSDFRYNIQSAEGNTVASGRFETGTSVVEKEIPSGTYYIDVTGKPGSYTLDAEIKQEAGILYQEKEGTIYRIFNPTDGDHIYTTDFNDVKNKVGTGWELETSPGVSSSSNGVAIYGLYNVITGENLYTADKNEANTLSKGDWRYHNGSSPVFYGANSGKAFYRLYNPNAATPKAAHHFTADKNEVKELTKAGWQVDNGGNPVFYLAQ